MGKINKDNLGYLGLDFQYRLIQQMLVDRKFGESIIDILKPNYFEDSFLRTTSAKIIDNYEKYETIPDVKNLESTILGAVSDEIDKQMYLEQFNRIKDAELNNGLQIQDTAMKFCKQQELKKSVRDIQQIIDKGDLEDYHMCEEILKKALEVGDNKDDGIDVFNDIENVLAEDFRQPIATGINGLDSYMDGGLAKGELGVILAPFGVGKTTIMTKLGNHAKNIGQNVLQIFFEDNPKVIQRKHLTCWMNGKYSLNELNDNAEEIFANATIKQAQPGNIHLKKFPSDGTTIPMIKQYIKKRISQGHRPDIILLDYIDCVVPTKQFKDEYAGEGNVMRQFETMLDELDLAGWTAVQGNRSSINAETVDSSMIGGSIKKGQIGHFILSIAKSLEQKESGHANMAILKSRFGKDGIVFEDIIFNNGTLEIDISEEGERGKTFLETEEIKLERGQNRVTEVFEALQKKKRDDEAASGNTNNNF
jgi:hypothetical protein